MNITSLLLTEYQDLNSLLYTPLHTTKRIQYTCITVSKDYIVLGAISGSLYLFTREPCTFKQLIPLSGGQVSRIRISPDQKTIALATIKGSICLISLKPVIKLMNVYTEHVGKNVTCICWNDNNSEIYVGDQEGKISVYLLSAFKVNDMFQSPSCSLMNLGSKIVQIDFSCTTILISTLKCCYVCDTVSEEYKQIGNKLRYGEFGACFYQPFHTENKVIVNNSLMKNAKTDKLVILNRKIKNESNYQKNSSKIFCARPGSRFWEVTATGDVIRTHQFKEALAIAPIPVYKTFAENFWKLKESNKLWPIQSINFCQVFVVSDKYLLSYTIDYLYIFDPENSKVVLWNDEFKGIFMVSVINDDIYLMMSSGIFHHLTLVSVSSLILNLYKTKLYKECLVMCHIFQPEIIKSITENFSYKNDKKNSDDSDKLDLIMSLIKSNYNFEQKESNNLINSENRSIKNNFILFDKKFKICKNLDNNLSTLDTINDLYSLPEIPGKIILLDKNSLQRTINNVHDDLELLYSLLRTKMNPSITETDLKEIIKLFTEKLNNIKIKYKVPRKFSNHLFEIICSTEIYYCKSILQNLSLELLNKIENEEILNFLTKIFIDLNSLKYSECCCSFPYPIFGTDTSQAAEPKFFEIGKILLKKFHKNENVDMISRICKKIPPMWGEYLLLAGQKKSCIPDSFLIQCLQTRDNFILSTLFSNINKQQWKVANHCFKKIKNGHCINCCNPYNNKQIACLKFTIDWSGITYLIIKKQGPYKAMTIINEIHENLSQVLFDKSLYQSIIFSSILSHHGVKDIIQLTQTDTEYNSIYAPGISQEARRYLTYDLGQSIYKEKFGSGPYHWRIQCNLSSSLCPCCTLSLQTPILLRNSGVSLFPCGHAYHIDCMIQKKISKCKL